MSKPHTILDLNKYVKLSRELAILGEYEKALSKYKTVLNIVTQRNSEVTDLSLKDKWSQVENLIQKEIIMTQKALNIARTFQNSNETNNEEPKNGHNPRWKKLNGMRFLEYLEKEEPEDKKERDPDLWPIPKVKSKNNKNSGFNKDNDKGKEDENDPKSGKSAFYLHYYPEGEGPDGELIEMIEREIMVKNPNVKFEDIGGLEEAKNTLKIEVILPLLMPDFFRGVRHPRKGILLFGPPGTGKTLLAKALATQIKATFFNLSPTTFTSKWKGESKKLVQILFEMARFYAPSIVFINEVDVIGEKRDDGDNEVSLKLMAEMLKQMDRISDKSDQEDLSVEELKKNSVIIMGDTCLPWYLHDALKRRFEKKIYIPLPNSEGRREIFMINMKGIDVQPNIDWDKLVLKTNGLSGADIADVCREASLIKMRQLIYITRGKMRFSLIRDKHTFKFKELNEPLSQSDFDTALMREFGPIDPNYIKRYQQFNDEYANK